MKVLIKNNKVLTVSGKAIKAKEDWGPSAKSGGATPLRQVSGGPASLNANEFEINSYSGGVN